MYSNVHLPYYNSESVLLTCVWGLALIGFQCTINEDQHMFKLTNCDSSQSRIRVPRMHFPNVTPELGLSRIKDKTGETIIVHDLIASLMRLRSRL